MAGIGAAAEHLGDLLDPGRVNMISLTLSLYTLKWMSSNAVSRNLEILPEKIGSREEFY